MAKLLLAIEPAGQHESGKGPHWAKDITVDELRARLDDFREATQPALEHGLLITEHESERGQDAVEVCEAIARILWLDGDQWDVEKVIDYADATTAIARLLIAAGFGDGLPEDLQELGDDCGERHRSKCNPCDEDTD